jgi:predicted ATP-grasp superfamily ATP-dependent carboligase
MDLKPTFTSNSTIPAIVLGSSITVLGVLRSLGRENIPTIYISNDSNYITHSRSCKAKIVTSKNLSNVNSLSILLESLPLQRAVLFPCSDSLLLAVASLNPQLKTRFPSSHANIECIKKLLDKAGLAEILKKYELPHPKTYVIEKHSELKNLRDGEFEGAFLKPRDSHKFFNHYGVKAFQLQNREETLIKAFEIQKAGYSLVMQDYIPGPKSNHYFIDGFVDRFGKIQTLFARRRIRMYPPDFGNSSYMYSVSLQDVAGAVETLRKLFSNIKYRGIFSTEFKYDKRDGLYKVIEVNVRPWWYIEFATSCGINVCKLAYEDAIEQNVTSLNEYIIGKSFVYFYYDFLSFLKLHHEGKLKILLWLRTMCGAAHPIFNLTDPIPAIIKFFTWITNFVKRRIFRRWLYMK